ncbi:MAG: hypothetical protein JWP09_767 [Candidatus Taylorbacteria bacterium]|nr:hypothetical protein [Candidatus Taylorbacteria bacterium]
MNWGSRRKFKILGTIWAVIFIALGIFVYTKFLNKAPSCFDNVQNQDEMGVDCGGICALVCPLESRPPITVYSRLFKAGPGAYSALALVENPNQNVFSTNMQYIFKVYDEKNILLFEVPGQTFVPPGRVFPIFEHSILTGNREASKITFEINSDAIVWQKGQFIDPNIKVTNVNNEVVDTRSRITADIENDEVYAMKNMEVIAVVYDKDGNAHESSATIIDYISPSDKTNVTFTWNYKFDFDVSKIDVIPRPIPRNWQ